MVWPQAIFVQGPRPGSGISSLRHTLAKATSETLYSATSLRSGNCQTFSYNSCRSHFLRINLWHDLLLGEFGPYLLRLLVGWHASRRRYRVARRPRFG